MKAVMKMEVKVPIVPVVATPMVASITRTTAMDIPLAAKNALPTNKALLEELSRGPYLVRMQATQFHFPIADRLLHVLIMQRFQLDQKRFYVLRMSNGTATESQELLLRRCLTRKISVVPVALVVVLHHLVQYVVVQELRVEEQS